MAKKTQPRFVIGGKTAVAFSHWRETSSRTWSLARKQQPHMVIGAKTVAVHGHWWENSSRTWSLARQQQPHIVIGGKRAAAHGQWRENSSRVVIDGKIAVALGHWRENSSCTSAATKVLAADSRKDEAAFNALLLLFKWTSSSNNRSVTKIYFQFLMTKLNRNVKRQRNRRFYLLFRNPFW